LTTLCARCQGTLAVRWLRWGRTFRPGLGRRATGFVIRSELNPVSGRTRPQPASCPSGARQLGCENPARNRVLTTLPRSNSVLDEGQFAPCRVDRVHHLPDRPPAEARFRL